MCATDTNDSGRAVHPRHCRRINQNTIRPICLIRPLALGTHRKRPTAKKQNTKTQPNRAPRIAKNPGALCQCTKEKRRGASSSSFRNKPMERPFRKKHKARHLPFCVFFVFVFCIFDLVLVGLSEVLE
jgi:hypothetical protein